MGDYTMRVGNVEIVALSDMNCTYPTAMEELWPGISHEAWSQYKERYPDTFDGERMRLEIGCYLVRSKGQTILIDTGYGPGPIDYIGGLRGQLLRGRGRRVLAGHRSGGPQRTEVRPGLRRYANMISF